MHSVDNRVSVKYNNRPFVGVITMINDMPYVLPLTSQTTQDRKKQGKNKRAAIITTFIKDRSNIEIANILHNNMFPVKEGTYKLLDVDAKEDTYESNEIRYIRKHKTEIIKKAKTVYNSRIGGHNSFLMNTCCDFRKLEEHCVTFEIK